MRLRFSALVAAIAAVLVAGCATEGYYAPYDGYGYYDYYGPYYGPYYSPGYLSFDFHDGGHHHRFHHHASHAGHPFHGSMHAQAHAGHNPEHAG